MNTGRLLLALPALVLWAGCSHEAVPVRYGRDECAHCKMTLVDQRFGGELITAKGKVLLFDDLSCLLQYQQANPQVAGHATVYVIDFSRPASLVPAEQAFFLSGDDIRSPMGSGIAAFGASVAREKALPQLGRAQSRGWSELPRSF